MLSSSTSTEAGRAYLQYRFQPMDAPSIPLERLISLFFLVYHVFKDFVTAILHVFKNFCTLILHVFKIFGPDKVPPTAQQSAARGSEGAEVDSVYAGGLPV